MRLFLAGGATLYLLSIYGFAVQVRAVEPVPLPAAAAMHPTPVPDPLRQADFELAKSMYGKKGVEFIDARARVEYAQGHIKGALALPVNEFDPAFAQYEKRLLAAKAIFVYCHGSGCNLAARVGRNLAQRGCKNVYAYYGGWPQWNEHRMPVTGRRG